MASRQISDTDYTIEWLEEILRKDTGTKAKIIDFTHSEVGYGRGFVSQILILKLTWDTDCEKLPKSVALKIPSSKQLIKATQNIGEDNVDEQTKEFMDSGDLQFTLFSMIHRCEVAVYEAFRSVPPKNLRVAKSYCGLEMQQDHQGILVLEDLSHGATANFVDGLNLEQVFEVAEQLANLHVYSLTTNAWKNDKINMRFDIKFEGMPTGETAAAACLAGLKKENPEVFDPLAEDALKLCQSLEDISYAYHLNEKLGLPDVLVNGDLHCQNMIFEQPEEDSGKKTGKIRALVDSHAPFLGTVVSHAGNIMEDMVRIIISSVRSHVRRKHYVEVLKHYYECLEKSLGSKPPFTFDQVVESFKRSFKSGVVCFLPAIMFLKDDSLFKDVESIEEVKKELMLSFRDMLEDALEYEAEFSGK